MVTCLCALEASKYASNSGLLIFERPWDFAFNKRQPAKSLLPLLLAKNRCTHLLILVLKTTSLLWISI
jgi:hypothetical protein